MPALVCDPVEVASLIQRRRDSGAARYDEVWEGLYVMSPMPNLEHQWLVGRLVSILSNVITDAGLGAVYPGANVSDRIQGWEDNYRCPDVVVVLNESRARCRDMGPMLVGGPDCVIEVRSPDDKSFEKLEFYESIGVQELLIIERDSKAIRGFHYVADRLLEVDPHDGWVENLTTGLRFRTQSDRSLEVRTVAAPERVWRIPPRHPGSDAISGQ
jgi:Uma2 family endonuclease